MNIKVNQKMIKEMCGTVSFKRGEAYCRANKVTFEKYQPERCEATVTGTEDYHVTIERDKRGAIRSKCSCPSLDSFQKDCQHIAAVLFSIYEHQHQGTIPMIPSKAQLDTSVNQVLTNEILTLFKKQRARPSVHQLHFEKRKVMNTEFTCKPIRIDKGRYLFGIEVRVCSIPVQNIREFLENVKEGSTFFLSNEYMYDPSLYCFQKETDVVIKQLNQVIHDEKMYVTALIDKSGYEVNQKMLLIPPSSWRQLIPLLINVPSVKLEYDEKIYDGFHFSLDPLALQFEFTQTEGNGCQLTIEGLNRVVVFHSYSCVLSEGKLFQLEEEDCHRLTELKQMLNSSNTNHILIPFNQVHLFLEKVVPGLKKLGEVFIAESLLGKLVKTPLIAKLYLDRVNNRLLAGLEFHYDHFVINPLESRDIRTETMLIRDMEKEDMILQLMEDSLFTKTESGYYLQNEELEYEFLYHVIPKLEKLVQIYATTAVRNRVIIGKTKPMIRVKVKKERTDWLEFKFELDGIPEKQIKEVLLALEEKRKYYRLRNGTLLSLETREFEKIKRFLNELPVQEEDLESRLSVPIVRGFQLLDSVDPSTLTLEESFQQFLENLRNPDCLPFEVPKSLEPILRDYQIEGYKWMKILAHYGFGGILADDMGLGKTLQSITFILSELPNIRKRKMPILIVCPSSLTYNWQNEVMKFAPIVQALIIDGHRTERQLLQKEAMEMDIVITSYPLLRRDIKWYEKQTFHTAFFDEAQAFKNPITQTARTVKKIQADHRFALTGTPVENSLEELWSIFHVVFPELFLGLKEYSNLSRGQIARRIRPFLLRRLKEDVLSELPEKMVSLESSELLPDQKKLYAAYLAKLRHDTLKHLDKDTFRKNKIKILAGLTRLRQICSHPALFVDGYKRSSAKFEQLMQIVEESRLSGRRVLIFSQFTKMLEIIGRELTKKGLSYFYLDGQTPSNERVEICNQFNAGERDLFLISLKAGGTGLNLTGADTVILYDIWWNPAVEEQAADRAHRIGQKNTVQVIKLVARGTIEEKMNELQAKKRQMIEEIIDPDEKGMLALTEEDIREILMI